ncbi:hypothetical protein Btru_008980 [Bulinus truncatus]|nr:hypothetical protein Btru_008980 [Bulinus truncatus]
MSTHVDPTMSHQDNVSPGQCLTRTMSHQDNVSPGQCLTRTMSHQDNVSPGQCLTRTMSHQDIVSPGQCLTRTLSHQDNVSPGQCLTRTLSHQDNVSPGQCLTRTSVTSAEHTAACSESLHGEYTSGLQSTVSKNPGKVCLTENRFLGRIDKVFYRTTDFLDGRTFYQRTSYDLIVNEYDKMAYVVMETSQHRDHVQTCVQEDLLDQRLRPPQGSAAQDGCPHQPSPPPQLEFQQPPCHHRHRYRQHQHDPLHQQHQPHPSSHTSDVINLSRQRQSLHQISEHHCTKYRQQHTLVSCDSLLAGVCRLFHSRVFCVFLTIFGVVLNGGEYSKMHMPVIFSLLPHGRIKQRVSSPNLQKAPENTN